LTPSQQRALGIKVERLDPSNVPIGGPWILAMTQDSMAIARWVLLPEIILMRSFSVLHRCVDLSPLTDAASAYEACPIAIAL
jgi:hypothetical protein